MTLQWDANDPPPMGYRLFQRVEGQPYDYTNPVCTTAGTICKISDLIEDTKYYFVVRAYDVHNESGDSNEVAHFVVNIPSKDVVEIPIEEFKRHIANLKSAGTRMTNEAGRMEAILNGSANQKGVTD